jgi:hypothetical protein
LILSNNESITYLLKIKVIVTDGHLYKFPYCILIVIRSILPNILHAQPFQLLLSYAHPDISHLHPLRPLPNLSHLLPTALTNILFLHPHRLTFVCADLSSSTEAPFTEIMDTRIDVSYWDD